MANLPPTMSKADVCAYLLETGAEKDDHAADERMALQAFFEKWTDAFFARRGNPRTIVTPIAVVACEGAMLMIATCLGD